MRHIRAPALGLLATGIINALVAGALWISFMAGTISWVGSLADRSADDSTSSLQIAVSEAESTGSFTVGEVTSSSDQDSGKFGTIYIGSWSRDLTNRIKDFSFGTFIFSVAMAVLLIFASLRMLHLKDYGFCVFAAVLAVIPLHGAAPVGIGFGIWALVMLRRPEVQAAFTPSLQPISVDSILPSKGNANDSSLADALRDPALVVVNIVKILVIVAVCLLFSFGLIVFLTKLVALTASSDKEPIRPAFRDSVTAIADRIDAFQDQLQPRIDEFAAADDGAREITVADEIRADIQEEFLAIQQQVNELKQSAETTAEFDILKSQATRLLHDRQALETRLPVIPPSATDPQ